MSGGAFITRSTNDGYNWDTPRVVPTEGIDVSVSHGPVTELDDGSLLVPLEGIEPGASKTKVWVNRSTDGGETWEFHGTVADSKDEIGFMELRLLRLPSGRILATMRTMPHTGFNSKGFLEVAAHLFRGDRPQAIAALKRAIDAGCRSGWWHFREPFYDSMLQEPEWVELLTELEADIARQRQWYENHKDESPF